MNWLDWAIVFVIGLAAWNGLRRGMILTLTRLASFAGALVAAFVLTKPVVSLLETSFGAATSLSNTIGRWVRLPADFAVTKVSELSTGQLGAMLERSGLPEQYQDAVVMWIAEAPGQAAVSLAKFIHQGLALLLLNVITFLALLGLARWVISLFGKGVSSAVHHVGAGPLDHLGGLALGAAQGALFASIALGLALPVLATGTFSGIQDAVGHSRFASPLLSGFYLVAPWLRQIGTAIWERIT